MRESSIFYRSFYEAVKDLPPENQVEVYTAIFEYALNFKELELTGISKTIFTLIKPQIQANNKKYKTGKLGAEYGKLGGRGKKKKEKETPYKPQQLFTETPNVNANENKNDKENVNDNEKVNENVNVPAGEETIHPLQQFVKSLKEVSRIKTQLTYENCKALLTDHGEELVKEVLLAMENTKGITHKYTSVFLTVNSWAHRRKTDIRITDPGATVIKRPFKPITHDQL